MSESEFHPWFLQESGAQVPLDTLRWATVDISTLNGTIDAVLKELKACGHGFIFTGKIPSNQGTQRLQSLDGKPNRVHIKAGHHIFAGPSVTTELDWLNQKNQGMMAANQ